MTCGLGSRPTRRIGVWGTRRMARGRAVLLGCWEVDFVEDALGKFIDCGAAVGAAVDGVARDARKCILGFLATLIGKSDLHGRLRELRSNIRGGSVVDFVGAILFERAYKIRAGRRSALFIGRLLQDEADRRTLDADKGAIEIAHL